MGTQTPVKGAALADSDPGVPPSHDVRSRLGAWRRIGASPWVLDTLRRGIYLPWVKKPPRFRSKGYQVAPADADYLKREITRGLARGFYRELTDEEANKAHCIVGAFVTHSAGKQRLVIDYRVPNQYLEERKFKYESLYDLAPQLRPGDAMLSWDISDAFFHLEIRPTDKKYLCFTALGRVFEPVVMPFGLRLAPYYWTKVCRPVVAELRRMGFRIVAYVDDFGGAPPSAPNLPATQQDATDGGQVVRDLLAQLGLTLHPRKGVWHGPTQLPLLGHVVDTVRGLFILKPERAEKMVTAARRLVGRATHNRRWIKAKGLRSFCGLAVSSSLSVVSARFHLRALYNCLGDAKTGCVRLSHQALRDLHWWQDLLQHPGLGRALWPPPPAHTMHTDASEVGWGAVLDGVLPARGFHEPRRRNQHINVLELATVYLGLQSFRRFLTRRDTWILLKSDSMVTVGAVNAMASKSPAIMAELRRLHALCHSWGIAIKAEYLPSAVNAYADRLSRENDSADWSLPVAVFSEMEARFGPHTVDWFATHLNTRCGRFFSKTWTPGCAGVDALRHDWHAENGWATPPLHLIPMVVDKVVRSDCALTLVAPRWEAQPWYWRAVEACTEMIFLPPEQGRFRLASKTPLAPRPDWDVVVFRFQPKTSAPLQPYALSA